MIWIINLRFIMSYDYFIDTFKVILEKTGVIKVNLGTGQGFLVLDVIYTFEKVSGVKIPYDIVGRRLGDIGECYAGPSYASDVLD